MFEEISGSWFIYFICKPEPFFCPCEIVTTFTLKTLTLKTWSRTSWVTSHLTWMAWSLTEKTWSLEKCRSQKGGDCLTGLVFIRKYPLGLLEHSEL